MNTMNVYVCKKCGSDIVWFKAKGKDYIYCDNDKCSRKYKITPEKNIEVKTNVIKI